MMKTAYIVVDLGFGDAGKGSIVDYLVQTRNVGAIVRYTGGPHAAHHVVRSSGLSHAFCQFGATFKEDVCSHLGRNVIVKPENLLYEGQALEEKGYSNPFGRISIDPSCRIVTSYHAMLCQMKEVSRGDQRRGTVGIGAGEAVIESEETPDLALRVADLYEPEILRAKLGAHFEKKQRQAQAILQNCIHRAFYDELRSLYDCFMNQVRLRNVISLYQYFAENLPTAICTDAEFIEQRAQSPGDIVFEGAHAALLDHDYGYYPYVAKTDTTTREAYQMLDPFLFDGRTVTIGVVRAFGYRHGPGPFVTEDTKLSGVFEERHNKGNEWQGSVRYGWFDLIAIRHGIQINNHVDGLALTMLDHLSRITHFKVCQSYEYKGHDDQRLNEYFDFITTPSGRIKILGIRPDPTHRKDELSGLLFDCVPWEWHYFGENTVDVEDFIRFLESPDGLGLPVLIISKGPKVSDKKERLPVR